MNEFQLLYLVVLRGNINLNTNILPLHSSLSLIKPISLNITRNIFMENIRTTFAGENYFSVEHSIDNNINEYVEIDDDIVIDYESFYIRHNKHEIVYV